jgi:hypothetical protein
MAQGDLQPLLDSKPRFWPLKVSFFRQSFFMFLLRFFITFFFPSTMTPLHKRFSLYTKIMKDERTVTLFFSLSCPSLFYHD